MKRSSFRNLWLITVVGLLLSSWLLFQKAQYENELSDLADSSLLELKRERRSTESLAADLSNLDKLTIDEKTATRLGILRHLELQDKSYDFSLGSSQSLDVGRTKLIVRGFDIKAALPYAEALHMIDSLHMNPKVVLTDYDITAVNEGERLYDDIVKVTVKGSLYGLNKKSN